MNLDDRHCMDCGEVLHGRADKKFCSDQCRNSFNNRRNSDNNNLMRNVNNILRRNRRIMADLTPDGKATVSRERLIHQGFNFNYFTNTYVTRKGAVYYFCYEYGYLPLNEDVVAVVQRQENARVEKDLVA